MSYFKNKNDFFANLANTLLGIDSVHKILTSKALSYLVFNIIFVAVSVYKYM